MEYRSGKFKKPELRALRDYRTLPMQGNLTPAVSVSLTDGPAWTDEILLIQWMNWVNNSSDCDMCLFITQQPLPKIHDNRRLPSTVLSLLRAPAGGRQCKEDGGP
jgi:hypothetical protein